MPYAWSRDISDLDRITRSGRHAKSDDPILGLKIEAHNSLSAKGFVRFISATAFLMLIPILAFLGSKVLWLVLISLGLALAMVWLALMKSWKAGSVVEIVEIWSDNVRLTRIEPNGKFKTFETNPYWVRVQCHKDNGPVPNYVTLSNKDREVEVGSFLSEEERVTLYDELSRVLPAVSQAFP